MFDFFGGIISSTITTLFPVFASYKALRTSDPAQLTPWLMYWVVLSLVLLVESYIPLITWFPFYGWLRILPLTYLLLPGENQGATFLYRRYVHPFLAQHEADIEQFISTSHEKAKKAGLQYIQDIIEFVRVRVLGGTPTPPPPPNRTTSASYAQSLLARFSLPSAREGLAAPAGDFYGLLSAALQQATSGSGSTKSADAQARDLTASGTLIPPNIRDAGERLSYVSAQRDRLRVLLQAFDKEAAGLEGSGAGAASRASGEMRTSRSELDFDKISQEDVDESAVAWGQWARGKSKEFFGGSKDKSKGE